jgi:hypothetical protein
MGALAVLFAGATTAVAAKPCEAVEIDGYSMKIGVIGVDCQSARERAEAFYERWDPSHGYYPVKIDGFICSTASAGTDLRCHSGNRWIFGTTRPYEDVRDFHPPGKTKPRPPYFGKCPTRYPLENGTLERHHLGCSRARSLIAGFMSRAQTEGRRTARIEGFHCKNVPVAIQPGIVCVRGDQRARYLGYPPGDF